VNEPTVVVGVITKAHGLQGEVAVQNRSDNPDRWATGSVVFGEDGRAFTIEASRGQGGRLLLRFEGVTDRNTADALRGLTLVVPEAWLPDLAEGAWWPHQLEGCEVVTESGRSLGTITEIVSNPANDLWVATTAAGAETLVPAIRDVVVDVDVSSKRVLVRDVSGLTAPDTDD
jgi:16S rRNA processing protein RimM